MYVFPSKGGGALSNLPHFHSSITNSRGSREIYEGVDFSIDFCKLPLQSKDMQTLHEHRHERCRLYPCRFWL
jgi:hypothetical protein